MKNRPVEEKKVTVLDPLGPLATTRFRNLIPRAWTSCVLGFTVAIAAACGDGSAGDPPGPGGKDTGGPDGGGGDDTEGDTGHMDCSALDPELADGDAAELFSLPYVPTFDLYLPPDAWEQLQEDAVEEQYIEAEACFEGRGLGKVGLRFKGSYGSLYGCFDENNVNTCRKLGMKLKFNKYEQDQRFFGLKRLNFQGNRWDDSYMKEKLAYDLFRSMKIVAPRASWAKVRVNDELMGLYGMVEQIDGRFTDDRWPDNGDGNLYKELWPANTDEEWARQKLKTNEEAADVSAFMNFNEAMSSADEADLRSTLGEFTDLDYLARYMAVDDAIANYDGITAYYVDEDEGWSGNHNFYFYEEAEDRFTLIPWDLETTMMISSGFGNAPRWTEVPEDCDQSYVAWRDTPDLRVIAPGCDRMFRAMAEDLDGYRRAAQDFLDGPFAVDAMRDVIDDHAAFIREAAEADPNGPGKSAFESAVMAIRNEIPRLRSRLEYLLTGETWTPFEIDFDGVTDFEAQDPFGLIMGTELYFNGRSNVSLDINTEDPIAGERTFHMDFEYADEDEPWGQWLLYRVPLEGGIHDVTDLTGIRMTVRADQVRILRLDLNSPKSSAINDGIGFGWDIDISDEAEQVEVAFEKAAIVAWAVEQGLDPKDDLKDVLGTVSGLAFFPLCAGRDSAGFLPDGTTDKGFLEVDDIEFF